MQFSKFSLLVTYNWLLKFHFSSKSNKQVMLGVISRSNCFETGGIEVQERKMSCEFRSNYLSMNIV